MQRQLKVVRVLWLAHSFQPVRKCFGVAVITTWACVIAAGRRIPGFFRPFN